MRTALVRTFAVVAVAAILLAACGDDDDDATPAESPTTTAAVTTTSVADETTTTSSGSNSSTAAIALASNSTIGKEIVVDSEGRTLYAYSADTSADSSACTGGCATAWPPAAVTGEATAGEGLDQEKLTTLTRDDGATQVAYGGHPLYRYTGDTAAGDAKGQGAGESWYVVGADGNTIDDTGGDDDG